MRQLSWPRQLRAAVAAAGLTLLLVDSRAEPPGEAMVTIDIHARRFEPPAVTLHAGTPVRLVLINHDAELHAFVPGELFEGVNVRVTGNGAPDFGAGGLRKVIIPSGGRSEIRFTPERPGAYPYFCDMPGHEMRAVIQVER
ncbi:cupredoxin domain-containing protein [Candidatus Nitrospira bockiana]